MALFDEPPRRSVYALAPQEKGRPKIECSLRPYNWITSNMRAYHLIYVENAMPVQEKSEYVDKSICPRCGRT